MHVAMVGTRGVPAQYGGFETAVEEIGRRLVERGHQVTVYCRNRKQRITSYDGMRLVNLPALRKRSLETLSHTGLSVGHAMLRPPDAAILFNAGNAPLIPLLKARRIPTAIHVDGLEWKRAKWQGAGASYYRRAEAMVARSGLPLIADAQAIADYLGATYDVESYVIPYGAPVLQPGSDRLGTLGLTAGGYHLVVARMEPENHVDVIVEGYTRAATTRPLVVVGSAAYGDVYIEQVRGLAGDADVRFAGSIWDQDLLNQLYAHAASYLHGHSVGGTNPSLLRALGCAAPVTAYDVSFNREVTAGHARFFTTPDDVAAAVTSDDEDAEGSRQRGRAGQQHVAETYRWEEVTDGYERMLKEMTGGL